MRLVCPNCKANYEVPRHAVPIGGREVKCASCGHSWFQTRSKKSNDGELTEPENEVIKEDTEEVTSAASNQKKIDPSVIKILKEEAKREIEARDQERNKKNKPSKNKRSFKNPRNSEPATLTKDAILKHQSKDALAEAYANDVIPRARGEAQKILQAAEAYKKEVVAKAEGEASRFLAIYNEYKNAKSVTQERMYLETMEKVLADIDKVIIEKNAGSVDGSFISWPSIMICPEYLHISTRSFMRLKHLINVDFPQPDGPINDVTSLA